MGFWLTVPVALMREMLETRKSEELQSIGGSEGEGVENVVHWDIERRVLRREDRWMFVIVMLEMSM